MAPPPSSSFELALPATLAPRALTDERTQAELVVALFDEHAPALLRYIRTSGLDEAAAEDVLQDTFIALHRHLLMERPRTNLAGWLFQVAHNLSRREQRRRRRGIRLMPWTEAPPSRLVAPELSPERRFLHRETGLRVQAAVSTLPERDQRCLRLRAEGLQYRDIATALGISLGSVAKSVARSLALLANAAQG